MPYTLQQFGQVVKKKYPQLSSRRDEEVAQMVLQQYPEYQAWVQSADTLQSDTPQMIDPQLGSVNASNFSQPQVEPSAMSIGVQEGAGAFASPEKKPKKSLLGRIGAFLGNTSGVTGYAKGLGSAVDVATAGGRDADVAKINNEVLRLVQEAKQYPAGNPQRKALLAQAKNLSDAASGMANENVSTLENAQTARQMLGSTIKLGGTIASFSGIGAGAKAVAPARSFVSGAIQGAKAGAKVGGLFGGIQGFGSGLEEGKSTGKSLVQGAAGAVGGAVTGGAVGGVIGGVSGAARGYLDRAKEIRRMEAKGTFNTSNEGALRARLASTNPSAKEALNQGIPETDVKLLNGLKEADKKAAQDMFRVAQRSATDKTFQARPQDIAGKNLVSKVEKLLKIRSEVGKKLGDSFTNTKKIDISGMLDDYVDDLAEAGVDINKGKLVFDDSIFSANKSVQGDLGKVFNILKRGKTTDKGLWIIKRTLEDVSEAGKNTNTLTSSGERLLGRAAERAGKLLAEKNKTYGDLAPKYSELSRVLQKFGSYMGKDYKIYDSMDELAQTRAGEVFSRIMSNTAARPQAIVNDIERLLASNGVKKTSDTYQQFLVSQLMDDLFNLSQPKSLAGQVSRGTTQAMEGVQTAIDSAKDVQSGNVTNLIMRGLRAVRGQSPEKAREAIWGIISSLSDKTMGIKPKII